MMDKHPGGGQTEQFPLLKVDGGSGDNRSQPSTTVPSVGVVNTGRKHSFFERWPEFLSICWMTVILAGIGLLAFMISKSLCIKDFKKHRTACIPPRPPTEVFYHEIVDSSLPHTSFTNYAEYLAYMAAKYPKLKFQVFFLIDDGKPCLSRLLLTKSLPYNTDEKVRESIGNLKKMLTTYKNIYVSVYTLSKFLATTPLKNQWRSLSLSYIAFYIRVYSVWQNGGIALDLSKYYTFFVYQRFDKRFDDIFKFFNDDTTCKVPDKIDENSAINSMFSFLFKAFDADVNNTVKQIEMSRDADEVVLRREKRSNAVATGINESSKNSSNSSLGVTEGLTVHEQSKINNSITSLEQKEPNKKNINKTQKNVKTADFWFYFENSDDTIDLKNLNKNSLKPVITNKVKESKPAEINEDEADKVMFYDISFYTQIAGPSYVIDTVDSIDADHDPSKKMLFTLTLDPAGTFIAILTRQHPFLAKLMSNEFQCHRFTPKMILETVFIQKCSGIFRSSYCNNINMLI